jgi:SAM-dependent methyltransferase
MGDDGRAIVAAGYDALGRAFDEWSGRIVDPERDRLFGIFLDLLPAGAAVLDVGCGSGVPWTRRLAERSRDVTGIDISPVQASAARRNVPTAEIIAGDVTAAEFPAGRFDGVIALYSIGHVARAEHRPLFVKLGRWLRPGGLLLASLPAAEEEGWTGEWLDVRMFFSSLGAHAYRDLVRDLGWAPVSIRETSVEEPEGPTRFLWMLVRTIVDGTTPTP